MNRLIFYKNGHGVIGKMHVSNPFPDGALVLIEQDDIRVAGIVKSTTFVAIGDNREFDLYTELELLSRDGFEELLALARGVWGDG